MGLLLAGQPDGAAASHAFLKIRAVQPGVGPVAVRAIIQTSDGNYIPGEWGHSDWPAVELRGKAVSPESIVEVPIGTTRITVGKGPDYYPITVTTNLLEADETYTVRFDLKPVLDLFGKGWRAGDAHMHFFHGDDQVSRSPEEAYAICAAGGLNFASFAEEHFGAPNLTRDEIERVWRAYDSTECKLWLGAESPKNAWGHHASLVYDPWIVRTALPYNWGIEQIHQQGGVSFPVHPDRTFPFRVSDGKYSVYPLNNYYKFYPIAALTGHLLDGWSGISDEPSGLLTLAPYHKLLQLGYRIPLLTDSDFCMDRANNGLKGVGLWMNYFHLEGNPVSRAAVANAIRKGRVMATTGPLVLFTIDGAAPGDSLPADGQPKTARIQASYSFNPWTLSYSNFDATADCKITLVELIRNGEVVKTWNPDAPNVVLTAEIREHQQEASYMVRVLGNESVWMAGYSSPIYFEEASRPRQPEIFKSLIKGRVYDARGGNSLTAQVSCVRYGKTEWTIATDTNGLFKAMVPIDAELVARDGSGRELTRNLLNFEPAYAFCHNLPEAYTNKALSVEPFAALIKEMTWEFPMGWQNPASFSARELKGDAVLDRFAIRSAPEPVGNKEHLEIVMLLIDKTRVAPNDVIHYSVLVRQGSRPPAREELLVTWRAWDPVYPRMFSRYGTLVQETNPDLPLIDLGNGFFALSSSVVVPPWIVNANATSGALRFSVKVRRAEVFEEVNLTVPAGETRRQLLVSSTWDGLPANWGDVGLGPCLFSRDGTFEVRYPDYRQISVTAMLNGIPMRIQPNSYTLHVADADDALFEDPFYYDGQCEPEHRNIDYRSLIRPQPVDVDFSEVELANPSDRTPPVPVAMEPVDGAAVHSPVRFYFYVHDTGLSGAASATLYVDGIAVKKDSLESPVVISLEPGRHTWAVEGFDKAGNSSRGEVRSFTVLQTNSIPVPELIAHRAETNGHFTFSFAASPGINYLVERATRSSDWRSILRTNAFSPRITVGVTNAIPPTGFYRVRFDDDKE